MSSGLGYSLRSYLKHVQGLPIVHTDSYVCGLPRGHRFQMGKFRGVFQSLVKDGVVRPAKQVVEPSQITAELATLAHSQDYVERFLTGETTAEEQRRTGFKWSWGLTANFFCDLQLCQL